MTTELKLCSLNLTDEQFQVLNDATIENPELSLEEMIALAVSEWRKRKSAPPVIDEDRVAEHMVHHALGLLATPRPPDWRIGLTVKPKYRHDDLRYERGVVQAVMPSGTSGLIDQDGILQIRLESGTVIFRKADEWVTV